MLGSVASDRGGDHDHGVMDDPVTLCDLSQNSPGGHMPPGLFPGNSCWNVVVAYRFALTSLDALPFRLMLIKEAEATARRGAVGPALHRMP
jgi:hypothetical protein